MRVCVCVCVRFGASRSTFQSRTSLWASGESPSRRARFIETVAKSVLTVAVSGGAPLLLPADPSYAYEEAGSRWLPEVNNVSPESSNDCSTWYHLQQWYLGSL